MASRLLSLACKMCSVLFQISFLTVAFCSYESSLLCRILLSAMSFLALSHVLMVKSHPFFNTYLRATTLAKSSQIPQVRMTFSFLFCKHFYLLPVFELSHACGALHSPHHLLEFMWRDAHCELLNLLVLNKCLTITIPLGVQLTWGST